MSSKVKTDEDRDSVAEDARMTQQMMEDDVPRVIMSEHALLRWDERMTGEGCPIEASKRLYPPTRKERVAVFFWMQKGKSNAMGTEALANHITVFVNRTADAAFLCDVKDKHLFIVVTVARLSDCIRFLKRKGDDS